jgi:hypothetical protein
MRRFRPELYRRGVEDQCASAEGGCEADYVRTAAVLKAFGVESWSRKEKQIDLSRGAYDSFMKLEPVSASMGKCRKT